MEEDKPDENKSLLQQVFQTRLSLAEAAFQQNDFDVFKLAIDLIRNDLASLPETSTSVKEKWNEIQSLQNPETLNQFSIHTSKTLHQDIAPLMQNLETQSHVSAYEFDKVIALSQIELLKQSKSFKDLKTVIVILVDQLPIDLEPVKEKFEIINQIKILNSELWDRISVAKLDEVRRELRDLMQFRVEDGKAG